MGDQNKNLTKEYIQEEVEDPAQDIVEEEMQQFNLLVSDFIIPLQNYMVTVIGMNWHGLLKTLDIYMNFVPSPVQSPSSFPVKANNSNPHFVCLYSGSLPFPDFAPK